MAQKASKDYDKIKAKLDKIEPDRAQSQTKNGALGISSTGKEQAVVRGKTVN